MGLFRGKVKNYLKQVFLERERGILESFAQGMARELFNSINYFSIIAQVIIVVFLLTFSCIKEHGHGVGYTHH